ncbi:hypothetical protein BC940DRAFT_293419 [Gongronella butleri]|nr:hypothetical protein BC940DRAFT_293419 [Gongronella butleri]
MDTKATEAPDQSVDQLIQMGFGVRQAKGALAMFDNDVKKASNYLLDQSGDDFPSESGAIEQAMDTDTPAADAMDVSMIEEEEEEQEKEEDNEEDGSHAAPIDAKAQALHYQRLALQAKKQGDKKKAVALLRESKAWQKHHELQQQQQQQKGTENDELLVSTLSPAEPSDDHAPAESSPSNLPPSPAEPATPSPPASSSPVQPSSPPQPSTPASASAQEHQQVLQRIIQLQKEYKDAAHHYKDLGNLAVAKEMVKTSKLLLKTGIKVKQQGLTPRELDHISAQLPPQPDMTLGDGKWRAVDAPALASSSSYAQAAPPTTREKVDAQLAYQADVCHNLALQLAQPNSPFHPLEQTFQSHLVKFRAMETDAALPSMHYEQVDYAIQRTIDYLPLNQMELKIERGQGIQSLDIASVEPFVAWDLGGWPPENTAQANLNKGETPVTKGTAPEFDFQLLIPIARTNRAFMRYVQRKKIVLEVYHNRYNYGFLRRPMLIGKVVIPLDPLLSKTSISDWFDLVDANRKKMGGKLLVSVNLHQPLQGEDIIQKSEPWLVMDAWTPNVSDLLYNVGLARTRYQPPAAAPSSASLSPSATTAAATPDTNSSEPAPASTLAEINPTPMPAPAAAAPAATSSGKSAASKGQPKQETANDELEAAEDEFNSVDVLVSNMVLEHEMNLAKSAVGTGQLGTRSKDDWMDRQQALEIKMNMLVIQVQTGLLDMDTYLAQVEKRMDRDRQLALIFKKHGRLDLAKAALTRKKIMNDELEEAKEAMANQ